MAGRMSSRGACLLSQTDFQMFSQISKDDGIRADASVEGLGALKAVFRKDGTTTAGNSSQV